MTLTLLSLLACATLGSGQSQDVQQNPLNVPPAIKAIIIATASKELSHYFLPRGIRLDARRIPDAEKQKAVSVMKQILEPSKTPKSASLQWSAITNDESLNEHLFTLWTKNQARIAWSDVDQIVAVVSVTMQDILLPVEQPDVFVDVVSEWIVENFRMPDPLPAEMELFQTSMIEGDDPAISGYIAFPDEVSNRIAKTSLPVSDRWCLSFGFAATKTTLVLLIHTNWITTESPHRPNSRYRDGKRVSRFDTGGRPAN